MCPLWLHTTPSGTQMTSFSKLTRATLFTHLYWRVSSRCPLRMFLDSERRNTPIWSNFAHSLNSSVSYFSWEFLFNHMSGSGTFATLPSSQSLSGKEHIFFNWQGVKPWRPIWGHQTFERQTVQNSKKDLCKYGFSSCFNNDWDIYSFTDLHGRTLLAPRKAPSKALLCQWLLNFSLNSFWRLRALKCRMLGYFNLCFTKLGYAFSTNAKTATSRLE